MKWYRLAADQGYSNAQLNLGLLYVEGKGGLPQSGEMAVRWVRLAADQGDKGGQYGMGLFYEKGYGGLEKSVEEAVKWFRLAADQGFAEAKIKLDCYKHIGKTPLHKIAEAIRSSIFWKTIGKSFQR